MSKLNAASVTDKWASRAAGATKETTDGVNAVTVSPTQKAAEQADAYVAGVQRAASSGKWQRGLMRVSLQDWKEAMIKKGIPRIAQGVAASKGKYQAFMNEFIPHLQSVMAQLENMPRGDLETNIARANFVMRENARFQRSR